MEITEVVCFGDRAEWRAWLERHHRSAKVIWLQTHHKSSGLPRVEYDHAVEEALCFGWIDGIAKKYDPVSSVQRYTPRRAKSYLSELNRQRMFKMIRLGLMTEAGLAAVGDQLGREDDPLLIPEDVLGRLQADPLVWENFQQFPLSYQKLRIGFVMESRKSNFTESEKRLDYLIKMTAQGKVYGTIVDMPE